MYIDVQLEDALATLLNLTHRQVFGQFGRLKTARTGPPALQIDQVPPQGMVAGEQERKGPRGDRGEEEASSGLAAFFGAEPSRSFASGLRKKKSGAGPGISLGTGGGLFFSDVKASRSIFFMEGQFRKVVIFLMVVVIFLASDSAQSEKLHMVH